MMRTHQATPKVGFVSRSAEVTALAEHLRSNDRRPVALITTTSPSPGSPEAIDVKKLAEMLGDEVEIVVIPGYGLRALSIALGGPRWLTPLGSVRVFPSDMIWTSGSPQQAAIIRPDTPDSDHAMRRILCAALPGATTGQPEGELCEGIVLCAISTEKFNIGVGSRRPAILEVAAGTQVPSIGDRVVGRLIHRGLLDEFRLLTPASSAATRDGDLSAKCREPLATLPQDVCLEETAVEPQSHPTIIKAKHDEQVATLQARIARSNSQLKEARSEVKLLRKQNRALARVEVPQISKNPDEQLRFELSLSYLTRTPDELRATFPWPEAFIIREGFIESLEALVSSGGISRSKIVEVCAEILSGQARENNSRGIREWRTSSTGAPIIRDDGARLMRANIQIKSHSARRIRFWIRRDGVVELEAALLHDDGLRKA